ncbi:hypothetical protein C0Q70_05141 [Pomacea canaliculata]|uniref:STAS domain-containing protein n=1 Tax=Pomacea canaliculata TaxID=400727 RepID=A0A2T7PKC0_POMCA|nr:hypothetical protein C0Q70_05141 [Pomacea canaliculata]
MMADKDKSGNRYFHSSPSKETLVSVCRAPMTQAIRYYKLREFALTDLSAGLTVGILQIPMALAFGELTSVKMENGLYSSVWPVLVYVLFGTSPHVSMGTSAVVCILTAAVVNRMGAAYASSRPWLTNVTDPATGNSTLPLDLVPEYLDYKEEICMGITLITGVMMVVLGLFKLGFITYYLSDSFFAAFTSAAGLHIGVSQLPGMLGIQIPQFSGMFKIIHSCRAIIDGVSNVNWASLIISVIVCIVVQLFKDCVNERFKHKLPAPIPTELLVVIVATVISHLGEFQENFGVKVVGQVPNYFSAPVLPTTGLQESEAYIKDCFVLAILIFAYTIAVAKICAKKHNYEVDNSQEMIAYGMCNLLTSFLKCFPTCVAPSRSMVASNMNAKTILNGVYSVVLMLLFVLFVGPLLEALPRASLAAIIFISLKVLVVQILDCRKFWRINKLDFVIWVFTFFSTTFLDIDYGLLIGFCVSVLTIIIQGQLVRGDRLERTGSTSVMAEVGRYAKTSEIAGVMIFRFQSSLFFANAEIFRSRLYKTPSTLASCSSFLGRVKRALS